MSEVTPEPSNSDFKICGFYTANTPYESEIQGLITSCRKFGIEPYIKEYKSRGTWSLNCCIKPEFILHCMEKFPDSNILYLDADSVLLSPPTYFSGLTCDIGFHFRRNINIFAGTIFIKNCKETLAFIKKWISACAGLSDNSRFGDQDAIIKTIKQHGQDISVGKLPEECAMIFDNIIDKNIVPVIQHNQASRKHKETEGIKSGMNILGINGIRRLSDGSLTLIRKNKEAEEYLDATYKRSNKQLRWYPDNIIEYMPGKDIMELKPIFNNRPCYIIGKGLSLDNITKEFFIPEYPVLCINQSIHKIARLDLKNPFYQVQQDASIRDECITENIPVIIGPRVWKYFRNELDKYLVRPQQLGLPDPCLTSLYCIELARMLGSSNLIFVSFDACVNGNLDYADCIGSPPTRGGNPSRFLSHCESIRNQLNGMEAEFVTPKGE